MHGTDLQTIIRAGTRRAGAPGGTLERAVSAMRAHLNLEVAYASEFVGDTMVLREVEAPGFERVAHKGASFPLDAVYCRHILAGRLPELIPDTSAEPLAMGLPITRALPIGAHLSVPIRLPDGSVYGMFCCLSTMANPSLNTRDLQIMRAFADLAAYDIHNAVIQQREARDRVDRLQRVIDDDEFHMAYQPIWSLDPRRPVGFESLARFTAAPARPPDLWFAEAAEVGRGAALEIAAMGKALAALPVLPPGTYLALNASPDTVLDAAFTETFDGQPLERIVLEVTEHASVTSYDALVGRIGPMRRAGLRLAVDDAGAGYSGLQHILRLRPDLIKLDMSLTRDIDSDPARQALAAALVAFARDTGSTIIAEGVETAAELAMLEAIGIGHAQGYFLARPVTLAELARPHPRPATPVP